MNVWPLFLYNHMLFFFTYFHSICPWILSFNTNIFFFLSIPQFFAQFAASAPCPRSSASLSSPSRSTSQSMLPMLSGSRTSLRTEQDNQGFSACLLYKGYVDDPRNTDNAWVEAEVWNFHYDFADTFDTRILEVGF